jgi:hypothetical protein
MFYLHILNYWKILLIGVKFWPEAGYLRSSKNAIIIDSMTSAFCEDIPGIWKYLTLWQLPMCTYKYFQSTWNVGHGRLGTTVICPVHDFKGWSTDSDSWKFSATRIYCHHDSREHIMQTQQSKRKIKFRRLSCMTTVCTTTIHSIKHTQHTGLQTPDVIKTQNTRSETEVKSNFMAKSST